MPKGPRATDCMQMACSGAGCQATQSTATSALRGWIAITATSTFDFVSCRCATATKLRCRCINYTPKSIAKKGKSKAVYKDRKINSRYFKTRTLFIRRISHPSDPYLSDPLYFLTLTGSRRPLYGGVYQPHVNTTIHLYNKY